MPLADRIIRFAATLTVLLVAGIAGFVSYSHAVEVIERAGGQSELAARLIPATVDGLALCASLVMLFAARYNLQVPRLARIAVGMGIGATLAANLLHGASHGLIAAIVAMWPALALLVSYELLIWLVGAARQLDRRAVVVVEPVDDKEQDPQLLEILRMLGANKSLTAAAIGRQLGLPYERARKLTNEARQLLVSTTF